MFGVDILMDSRNIISLARISCRILFGKAFLSRVWFLSKSSSLRSIILLRCSNSFSWWTLRLIDSESLTSIRNYLDGAIGYGCAIFSARNSRIQHGFLLTLELVQRCIMDSVASITTLPCLPAFDGVEERTCLWVDVWPVDVFREVASPPSPKWRPRAETGKVNGSLVTKCSSLDFGPLLVATVVSY